MKIRIGNERFTPLPAGYYRLRAMAIRENVDWPPYGKALEWEFEVAEGPFTGCRLQAKMNRHSSLGPTQKFGRWYFALTGVRLKGGAEVDPQELVSKTCWAVVTQGRSSLGKPSNNVELIPGNPIENDAHP